MSRPSSTTNKPSQHRPPPHHRPAPPSGHLPTQSPTPEPFLTPWDKGYWTPQRRHSLKVLNYSLPIVVGCGYALYLQLYDQGTRQRVEQREREREVRRQLGQKEPPLNIVEVLTQKLPEEPNAVQPKDNR